MRRKLLAMAISVSLPLVGRAYAHHSVAATYMVEKQITIEGNVVEFLYGNPHSFVKVEASDYRGHKQDWAVEWLGVLQLSRVGVSRDSLRPGDHVIVSGNPCRNPGEHRIRMRRINRPSDGWKWASAESASQNVDPLIEVRQYPFEPLVCWKKGLRAR